jgi:hypothetical protein
MSSLEEMLESMGKNSSLGKKGYSEDVEVIKKYLDAPKLTGLKHGDVLEQIGGHEDQSSYSLRGNVVFDRSLTENEKELYMVRDGAGGARDVDIRVASSVGGAIPMYHFVDSRAFRKVSQE